MVHIIRKYNDMKSSKFTKYCEKCPTNSYKRKPQHIICHTLNLYDKYGQNIKQFNNERYKKVYSYFFEKKSKPFIRRIYKTFCILFTYVKLVILIKMSESREHRRKRFLAIILNVYFKH